MAGWGPVVDDLSMSTVTTALPRSTWRRVERTLVGFGMTIVAWVLERMVKRSTRQARSAS